MADRPDLAKLAQRIPDQFVEQVKAQGGSQPYIAHHVINQFLLYILGPFDFELVQVHRGDVLDRDGGQFIAGKSATVLSDVVVGATYRLRCTVDDRVTVIEATGDVDRPTNWQHDGARLKDAESDALKRAAMRLGLGLELWAQEHYKLDKWLPVNGKPEPSEGRGERAVSRSGSTPEPATTRVPSDPIPAGAAEEDRPPAPAGPTPAGASSVAPGAPAGPADGAADPDPEPDPGPEQAPDDLLANLAADATAAEKAFAAAGLTITAASALMTERYPGMALQYSQNSLRRLRGQVVIREYVAEAVKLRTAKATATATAEAAEVAS